PARSIPSYAGLRGPHGDGPTRNRDGGERPVERAEREPPEETGPASVRAAYDALPRRRFRLARPSPQGSRAVAARFRPRSRALYDRLSDLRNAQRRAQQR